MPLPRRVSRAAYLVTLAAAACASPATPDDRAAASAGAPLAAGSVTATAKDGAILLRNGTDRPIGWTVLERQTSTVALWRPCVPGPTVRCAGLAPGDTQRILYQDISGYEPGKAEAVVYWWHVVSDPATGESRVEEVRSFFVRL